MTSGLLQGSGLGPQLFRIYINDLNEGIECIVTKFADKPTIDGKACCKGDIKCLQRDLDSFSEWASILHMEYNAGKSEVIHFGGKNKK